ncbi:MAG: ParA family protein [Acidimicrobiales bacterium]
MKVAATYSIKGGVGKTSAAVNLAYEAAHAGVRVLVWDLDPQGGATFLLRVRPKLRGGSKRLVGAGGELAAHVRGSDVAAVHVIPADFSLRHLDLHLKRTDAPGARLAELLHPVRDDYDLALLDCPPSISLASESVFGAADALLVPVVPATLASRTLRQLTRFLEGDPNASLVVPFLSMVDRRRKLQRELVDELVGAWPALLATAVPASAVIERMGSERAPVATFAPSTPARRAYRDLWGDVARVLWPAAPDQPTSIGG